MPVVVIYAKGSRTIRRVIVTDENVLPDLKLHLLEGALLVPFEEYTRHNDRQLRAFVAAQVGEPTHSTRCVEVDGRGVVLAALCADPDIDHPPHGGTLQLHETADVGDVKFGEEFVPMKPIFILNRDKAIARVVAREGVSADEAAIAVDVSIENTSIRLQRQKEAAASAGVQAPQPVTESPD